MPSALSCCLENGRCSSPPGGVYSGVTAYVYLVELRSHKKWVGRHPNRAVHLISLHPCHPRRDYPDGNRCKNAKCRQVCCAAAVSFSYIYSSFYRLENVLLQ